VNTMADRAIARCAYYERICEFQPFTRTATGEIIIRVGQGVGAVRIPHRLSEQVGALPNPDVVCPIIGDRVGFFIWLTRPAGQHLRNCGFGAMLAQISVDVLPPGTEIVLPGPCDEHMGGRWWVRGLPTDAFRPSADDVVNTALTFGRMR